MICVCVSSCSSSLARYLDMTIPMQTRAALIPSRYLSASWNNCASRSWRPVIPRCGPKRRIPVVVPKSKITGRTDIREIIVTITPYSPGTNVFIRRIVARRANPLMSKLPAATIRVDFAALSRSFTKRIPLGLGYLISVESPSIHLPG